MAGERRTPDLQTVKELDATFVSPHAARHIPENRTRNTLHAVMRQAENDLKAAHRVICELQNLDPDKHDWPEWSSPANTLRWFETIREQFPQEADPGRPVPHHGSGPDN